MLWFVGLLFRLCFVLCICAFIDGITIVWCLVVCLFGFGLVVAVWVGFMFVG